MNVITTTLVIWSIYIGDQNVEALTCLQCDYVVQPRHCETVLSCPDDDACFVERKTNSFGEVGYSVGCRAKRSCGNSTTSSSNCALCCDRDLCNQAGCGEEGFPSPRGPVCYSCQNPLPDRRCHHVDVCPEGEMCSVIGKDKFGTTLFTSGCLSKELCAFQHTGVLVGRSIPLKIRALGPHDCNHCCEVDLCNKNCQPRDLLTPTARDCSELHNRDSSLLSGVYNITTPLTHTKIQVFCDMDTDGGGWTIFQKRFNGSVDFYRPFRDYENGFGSVQGEHWLGLKYIYEMTTKGDSQLLVDIERSNGSFGFEVLSGFSLGPGTNYTLILGSRIRSHAISGEPWYIPRNQYPPGPIGRAFSTFDHDVDEYSEDSCALVDEGGWWYGACYYHINLNGRYLPGSKAVNGINCYDIHEGLKTSSMGFKAH